MEESQTADIVRKILDKEIFISDHLAEGLINHSALARKLLPEIQKENEAATIESVTIAIKRSISRNTKSINQGRIRDVLAGSQLTIRNKIMHLTFERTPRITSALNVISTKAKWALDDILLINQGSGEITVIADIYNKRLFSQISKEAIATREDIAILTLKEGTLDLKGADTPGLYSFLISNISRKGINIIDIISTRSQISLIISESDVTRAYEIMNNLII